MKNILKNNLDINLIIFSISYRIIIFFSNGNLFQLENKTPYTDMLENNFTSFLFREHTKPLITYLRDFISFNIYKFNYTLPNLIFLSFLDIIAAFIYSKLIYKFTNSYILKNIGGFLLSIAFVTWEYWWQSSHFDHLSIFLFAICLDSTTNILANKNLKNLFYFVFSYSLLCISHSFGIILFLSSLTILFFSISKKYIIFSFLVVFIIYLSSVFGNIYRYQTPFLSTLGPPNRLQLIWTNAKAEKEILSYVRRSKNLPNWYKNCFLEAYESKRIDGRYESIYGWCMPYPNVSKNNLKETKTYLQNFLINNEKDKELQKIIQKDLKMLEEPYHFTNNTSGHRLNFHVYYGKFSGKVASWIILNFPFIGLYAFAKSFIIAITQGSLLFTGQHYDASSINLPYFHKNFNYVVSIFIFFGFILSFLQFIKLFISFEKKRIIFPIKKLNLIVKYDPLKVITIINVIFIPLIYSISTCCEVDRMMAPILPYCLIIFFEFLNRLKIGKLYES